MAGCMTLACPSPRTSWCVNARRWDGAGHRVDLCMEMSNNVYRTAGEHCRKNEREQWDEKWKRDREGTRAWPWKGPDSDPFRHLPRPALIRAQRGHVSPPCGETATCTAANSAGGRGGEGGDGAEGGAEGVGHRAENAQQRPCPPVCAENKLHRTEGQCVK